MRTPALLLLAALLVSCGERAKQGPDVPSDSTAASNATATSDQKESTPASNTGPSALQDTGVSSPPKKSDAAKSNADKPTSGSSDKSTAEKDEDGSTVRRVRFEKGRTTAVLKGNIKDNQEITYLLGASEGQTMTVNLTGTTKNHDLVFTIESPDGTALTEEGELTTDWSGLLPASGDYRIHVGLIESKSSAYTLEVMIR